MAMASRLLNLFRAHSTELACIRETILARHGVLARGLSSPAASEVERETEEGSSTRAPADGSVARRPWTPQSRRTGVIAVKLGMTQLWDKLGEPVPVTVLQVEIMTEIVLKRIPRESVYSYIGPFPL